MPAPLEFAPALSLVVAVTGLAFGYVQHRKRAKTELVLRTQLNSLLNRVRAMVPYRSDLESMLQGIETLSITPWAWNKYKGLSESLCCDCYLLSLV